MAFDQYTTPTQVEQTKRRQQQYSQPTAPSTPDYSSVTTVDQAARGTLSTHMVAYLAGLTPDQAPLAKLAQMYARRWTVDPMYVFGTRNVNHYVSPITGKKLSMQEAQRFTDNYGPVALAAMLRQSLTVTTTGGQEYARPFMGPQTTIETSHINPKQVGEFARIISRYSGADVDLGTGMGLSVQLAKDGQSTKVFENNMEAVKRWLTSTGDYHPGSAMQMALQLTYTGVRAKGPGDVVDTLFPGARVSKKDIEAAKDELRRQYSAPDATVGLGPEFDIQLDVAGAVAVDHQGQVRAAVSAADKARKEAENAGATPEEAQSEWDAAISSAGYPVTMSAIGPDYWKDVEAEQDRIEMDNQAFSNNWFNKVLLEPMGYVAHLDQVLLKNELVAGTFVMKYPMAAAAYGEAAVGVPTFKGQGAKEAFDDYMSAGRYATQRLYTQQDGAGSLIAPAIGPAIRRLGPFAYGSRTIGDKVADFADSHEQWFAGAIDLGVGWVLDPLVILGKMRVKGLEGFLVPGTLDHGQMAKKVIYGLPGFGVKIEEADKLALAVKVEKWVGKVDEFAGSKISRGLFASEDDTSLFRRIYRLRGKVEARGTLDVQYMKALRDRIITKFGPEFATSEEAWAEWQTGVKAHFFHYAPPDTIAAEVVNARDGLGFRSREEAAAFTGTVATPASTASRMSAIDSEIRLMKLKSELLTPQETSRLRALTAERKLLEDAPTTAHQAQMLDIIDDGGSIPGTDFRPGWLSQEVPGITKLSEWGPRRAIRSAITSDRVTSTTWGKHLAGLPNVNPGRVAPIGDSRAMIGYVYENNSRWAVYSEAELRTQQSELTHIYNSGGAVETRVAAKMAEWETEGFNRWIAPFNVNEEVASKLRETLLQPTIDRNAASQKSVFGVVSSDAQYGRASSPVARIPNETFTADMTRLDSALANGTISSEEYDRAAEQILRERVSQAAEGSGTLEQQAFRSLDRRLSDRGITLDKATTEVGPLLREGKINADEATMIRAWKQGVPPPKLFETPASRVAGETRTFTKPLIESQMVNKMYVVDPMMVRTGIRHYISLRDRLSQTYLRVVGKEMKTLGIETSTRLGHASVVGFLDKSGLVYDAWLRMWKSLVVARPAYFTRVVMGDENLRFLATTSSVGDRFLALGIGYREGSPAGGLLATTIDKVAAQAVKQRLDDAFAEVIKVGDTEVRVLRAGAMEYSSAAAGNVRESDLIVEMVKGRNNAYQTFGADGSYNVIQASSFTGKTPGVKTLGEVHEVPTSQIQRVSREDWEAVWSSDLVHQWKSSDPATLALESVENSDGIATTAGKLVDWARDDKFVTLETRIGYPRAEVDIWAERLAGVTHSYTMGDANIARMARLGDREGLIQYARKNVTNIDDLPLVHAPTVQELSGGGPVASLVNKGYSMFVQRGENAWNRQPFFSEMKRRSQTAMLKTTDAMGGQGTPEVLAAIDRASTDFALGQVRRVMFDFTRQSRFSEMLQLIFPFPQPFFEGFQAWGHIAYRNPVAIIHGKQLFEAGVRTGFFKRDPNSGEYMVPNPVMQKLSLLGASIFGSDATYETFKQMDTPWMPLANMNMLTASTLKFGAGGIVGKAIGGTPLPVPSFNPLITYAASTIFAKLGWDKSPVWQGYALQYGSNGLSLPGTISKLTQIFMPKAWKNSNTFKSLVLTVVEGMQRNGWDVDENGNRIPLNNEERQRMLAAIENGANITIGGDGQETLESIATSQAENLMQVKAGFDLFNPTGARLAYEGQRDDYAAFGAMQDAHGGDFLAALNEWYATYPDKTMIPIGKTLAGDGYEGPNSGMRVPASELTFQMYRMDGIGSAMQHNPALAALMLVGTDPNIQNQQDFKAFSDIMAREMARYKMPDEYWSSATEAAGWRSYDVWLRTIYYPEKDRLTQAHGGSEGSAELSDAYLALKQERAKYMDYMYTQNPSWVLNNAQYNPQTQQWNLVNTFGDDRRSIDSARGDIRNLTQIEGLQNFPGIQSMKEYIEGTDKIREQMQDRWVSDINSDKAKEAGLFQKYDKLVSGIVADNPEVLPFLRKYFGVQVADDWAPGKAATVDGGGQVLSTDDLVYGTSEREWAFSEIVPDLTTKYMTRAKNPLSEEDAKTAAQAVQDNVVALDEHLSHLKRQAYRAPMNSYERSLAYQKINTLLDTAWRAEPTVLKNWWKAMGPSQQQEYRTNLATKPVDFYTVFDFHVAGINLSAKAQKWWSTIEQARVDIAKFEEKDPVGYSESGGYEAISKFVKEKLGTLKENDKSGFREAVKAASTWGWGVGNIMGYGVPIGENDNGDPLFKSHSDRAWYNYLKAVRDAQQQIIAKGWTGVDSFDTDANRDAYKATQRSAIAFAKDHFDVPGFKDMWQDLQADNGDPLVGSLFFPDSYFGPLGAINYGG